METKELSPAMLQAQVTVVATLGELLDTLPRRDEEETLLKSPKRLYRGLEEFTEELWVTLHCIDDTWRRHIVTVDDGDPVTSLSRALAAYKSTPRTTQESVTMAARKWQWSVSVLVDRWARLTRKATELHNTWSEVATEAITARARELQAEAARYGTSEEHKMELGQALGREEGAKVVAEHEAPVREEARVAASEATRATMVRQRVWTALGLLERLVAACDEAAMFPRELRRLLRDTEIAQEGTKKKSPNVAEELVAKVAEAERLWEANARLAKGHLLGIIDDIIDSYFIGGYADPSACGVAKRCQRAIEDISRLLRPPEHPQRVPKVSPVSTEPQELSPALLQPQVTVVATLDELLATLPMWEEEEMLLECPGHTDLQEFTQELRVTLQHTEDTCWDHIHHIVTDDADGGVTSLSQALAALRSTPGTTQGRVTMAASKWQGSVNALVNSWAQLVRAATKLRDTCRVAVTEALRELQAEAALYGTAQEHKMELGQALGGEEGAEVVAGHEARVRREAMVAASEATMATMVRQRLEVALGLLERLVAACDEATTFTQELQRRVGDIEATLEGTNEASPDVPEGLVAKVAEAERLWEANARLARNHLLGTVDDITKFYFIGGRAGPSARGVAEQCVRAMEDIPRLLRPLERPQGVPEVFPVSTEPQELSPAMLQAQVTTVATLGELLATLPTQEEEETLLKIPKHLQQGLEEFTKELRDILYHTDDTWWRHIVTSNDGNLVTSLSGALATYKSTPGTTWNHVAMAATELLGWVSLLVPIWAELSETATKLCGICRQVAAEAAIARARQLQDEAAHDETSEEHMMELGQALGGEQGAEGVARPQSPVREEPMVAASEATRATMVREQLEAALGLLPRLVAACDEATRFPRELRRLLRDTKTALKRTKKKFPNVPKDLVAKAAEAELLWEANARLAKDHLLGAVDDIIDLYFPGGCARPTACGVAERCLRAIEDIPRLLRPPECPQRVPEVSPVSMEPEELSLALLQPPVTVVATLGELLTAWPTWKEEMRLFMSPKHLYNDLQDFTEELRATLQCTADTWRGQEVTSDVESILVSLSQALASYNTNPQTTQDDVTMVASNWQRSVSVLVGSWAELARKAAELHDTCRNLATKAPTATTRARELQALGARYRTAEEHKMEPGQARGRVEGAEVVARRKAQVREQARVVASRATRATMERQWMKAALGLLPCLVAACDKATAFPQELQRLLRDTEAALEGTNEVFPTVPEDLVAKVGKAERLWEANARLAKGHLLGIIEDILDYYSRGGRARPSAHEVAKRCQRATEDIPNLLQG